MTVLPGIILFCNADLTPGVQDPLMRQLYISEAMTGDEFDSRIIDDPNYPSIVHSNNLRILVIRSFRDGYCHNRDLADIAIFIKAGLATIEGCKYGPPGQTFDVDRLTIYELLSRYPIHGSRFVPGNVQNNILVPMFPDKHKPRLYPFGTDEGISRGGRGADITPEKKDKW